LLKPVGLAQNFGSPTTSGHRGPHCRVGSGPWPVLTAYPDYAPGGPLCRAIPLRPSY